MIPINVCVPQVIRWKIILFEILQNWLEGYYENISLVCIKCDNTC